MTERERILHIRTSADLLQETSFTVDGKSDFSINFNLHQQQARSKEDEVLVEVRRLFDRDSDEWSHGSLPVPKQIFTRLIEDLKGGKQVDYEKEGRGRVEFKKGKQGELLFRLESKEPGLHFIMRGFRRIDGVFIAVAEDSNKDPTTLSQLRLRAKRVCTSLLDIEDQNESRRMKIKLAQEILDDYASLGSISVVQDIETTEEVELFRSYIAALRREARIYKQFKDAQDNEENLHGLLNIQNDDEMIRLRHHTAVGKRILFNKQLDDGQSRLSEAKDELITVLDARVPKDLKSALAFGEFEKRQDLLDTHQKDSTGRVKRNASGTCMYRQEDLVHFIHCEHDSEEGKDRIYKMQVTVAEYNKTLAKLQRGEEAIIERSSCSLTLVNVGGEVQLIFNKDPLPNGLPGIRVVVQQQMENLVLKE